MKNKTTEQLKAKREALRKELAGLGPVMRGSVVVIGTKSKRAYFSMNKDRKTRIIYLGEARQATARTYADNYRRLLAIADEMTLATMELLRRGEEA
ncbi:MAG: hypothetical protein EOM10_08625 [Opitutae bacterium]|nr:hypothetical protein [Opitutae bacterium]